MRVLKNRFRSSQIDFVVVIKVNDSTRASVSRTDQYRGCEIHRSDPNNIPSRTTPLHSNTPHHPSHHYTTLPTTSDSTPEFSSTCEPQIHTNEARRKRYAGTMVSTFYPRAQVKKTIKAHTNRPLSKNVDILIFLNYTLFLQEGVVPRGSNSIVKGSADCG